MVYAAERARLIGGQPRGSRRRCSAATRIAWQRHVSRGLIRMSVSCEDTSDVWSDLERAL
jgi:cystathionine beta-lyase/cystathionine gamma-synthase